MRSPRAPKARRAPHASPIRDHALRAIAANRAPGFHFVGHFLDVRWLETTRDHSSMLLPDAEHLRDDTGHVALTALAVFADTVLSTATRSSIEPGERLATVYLQAQFTGADAIGDIAADATMDGRSVGSSGDYLLSSAVLKSGSAPICYATGSFARLEPPPGVELAPLPWQRRVASSTALDEKTLTPVERAILDACEDAIARPTSDGYFLRRFWGGRLEGNASRGARRLDIGPHVSNRVGHVQGGILFGIAAETACDAVPAGMRLANVSAWYVSPTRGASLVVRACVLHAGRNTALVHTQVESEGRICVEVMTQHIAGAAAIAA